MKNKKPLPKHLQDWLDVDWSKAKPGKIKSVTRKELKEIRKSYQDDHAYDAIRYGMMMPSTPKKAGLFGRFIAWIKNYFK